MTCEINAVQHIRRMRGGSQPHLLRASDGGYYVTKFQANPQHTRILANEMLATRAGLWLGLPMPEVVVMQVDQSLIEQNPDLHFDFTSSQTKCPAGRQLGSRFAIDPMTEQCFEYLPGCLMQQVANIQDFARVLVLDKWLGNADGRQVVFSKAPQQRHYRATFVDQGYCFNAGEWTFTDSSLQGVYPRNEVYLDVTGWEAFEPVLTRAEECNVEQVWRWACAVPSEWYDHRSHEMELLVDTIDKRRGRIRDLITAFRLSTRLPFPNWSSGTCTQQDSVHHKSLFALC